MFNAVHYDLKCMRLYFTVKEIRPNSINRCYFRFQPEYLQLFIVLCIFRPGHAMSIVIFSPGGSN
jgi:hypothetical protein